MMNKATNVILSLFIAMVMFSCGHHTKDKSNAHQIDSLKALCQNYAMELQVDTLRQTASLLLGKTQQHSKEYYQALCFHILADFNAHDFNKVLTRIAMANTSPHFHDYPDVVCRYEYMKARVYQRTQQYDQAINEFKGCLKFDSPDDSTRENIRAVVVEAILQMMNSYQTKGDCFGCANYMDSLQKHPTPLIKKFCLRDLYSITAYSFYMLDDPNKSMAIMNKALSIPLYKSTPQRLFRDYSYAAAIYYCLPGRQKQTIYYIKKALYIGYNDKSISGLEWLTNLLGSYYLQTGEIEKAIDLYQWSILHSHIKKDLKCEADAYYNLANLYVSIDQLEQANEFANHSIQINLEEKDYYPQQCGSAYTIKGKVMANLNKVDSALYFYHKADSCICKLPYSDGGCTLDRLRGELLIDISAKPLQIQKGITYLKRALSVPLDDKSKASIFLQLAKGFIKQNKQGEGEAMLDSMYNLTNSSNPPIFIEDAYQFALQYYLKKHDAEKIARYATAYVRENELTNNKRVSKRITQFMLKYRTEKQSQQLRLTQSELKNKGLHLQIILLVLIVVLVLLIGSLHFYFYKKKSYKLRHQLMEVRLNNLSSQLVDTTHHSEEIEKELYDLLNNVSNKRQIAAVTPNMYRENGEAHFRSRFTQLYPSFLLNLKNRVPNITRTEEILCMLIVLEQTPEQIVDILCIARSSLNVARYRLRQKMQLQREESLEESIKSLLG